MSLAPEKNRTPEEMDRLFERTVRRGTALRRRNRLTVLSALIVLMVAVAVPVLATGVNSSKSPTLAQVAAGPYGDVAWRSVQYPGLNFATSAYPKTLGCSTTSTATPTGFVFPVDVQQVSYLQPQNGPRLAIVLVHCLSGSPTPSSLYAFDGMTNGHPQLFAVLLAPPTSGSASLWYATGFSTSGDKIVMPAKGVTGSAPVCCPNVTALMHWTWNGSIFERSVRTAPIVASPKSAGHSGSGQRPLVFRAPG